MASSLEPLIILIIYYVCYQLLFANATKKSTIALVEIIQYEYFHITFSFNEDIHTFSLSDVIMAHFHFVLINASGYNEIINDSP